MNTYKLLPKLPALPAEFEAYLWNLSNRPTENVAKYTGAGYESRVLDISNQKITSTKSVRAAVKDSEFLDWVRHNITDSWTECSLSVTDSTIGSVHGIHNDWTRSYLLIYLLEPGGDNVTVSWYQEKGFPVDRSGDLAHVVCDYSTVSLIDQTVLPVRTWAIYNVKVLHGVENLSENRVSLQIGLSAADYEKFVARSAAV
jgi:hypothetical protein